MPKIILCAGIFLIIFFNVIGVSAQTALTKDDIIGIFAGNGVYEKKDTGSRTVSYRSSPSYLKSKGSVPKDDKSSKDRKEFILNIEFEIGSYEIANYESLKQLANLGLALGSDQLIKLQVEICGYTCNLGDEKQNLELSQARSERVKTLLVDLFGIHPDRLTAIGYGEKDPLFPNTSEKNRKRNRRVVIKERI